MTWSHHLLLTLSAFFLFNVSFIVLASKKHCAAAVQFTDVKSLRNVFFDIFLTIKLPDATESFLAACTVFFTLRQSAFFYKTEDILYRLYDDC